MGNRTEKLIIQTEKLINQFFRFDYSPGFGRIEIFG